MSAVPDPSSQSRRGVQGPVVFAGRRPASMLALGFSAGLPAVLVFDVLSLWLRASGVSLEAIGFFSLVGLTYSLKFLWAPLLDWVELPLLSNRLGRRRAWMLACQIPTMLGLWLMSTLDPTRPPSSRHSDAYKPMAKARRAQPRDEQRERSEGFLRWAR